MSVPTIFASPQLHHKVIQNIQSLFQTELSWLQYCYPLAHVGISKDAEGNEVKYPRVYINDGAKEYYDIRPNDEFRSYGFFELQDPSTFAQSDNDGEIQYQLSFIVWFNFKTVSTTKLYDYSSELIKDVLRAWNEDITIQKSITNVSYDIDPNTIFEKYSLKITDSQFLMYPYGAFKINFDYTDYEIENCDPF
jgi:hypothetical protein